MGIYSLKQSPHCTHFWCCPNHLEIELRRRQMIYWRTGRLEWKLKHFRIPNIVDYRLTFMIMFSQVASYDYSLIMRITFDSFLNVTVAIRASIITPWIGAVLHKFLPILAPLVTVIKNISFGSCQKGIFERSFGLSLSAVSLGTQCLQRLMGFDHTWVTRIVIRTKALDVADWSNRRGHIQVGHLVRSLQC